MNGIDEGGDMKFEVEEEMEMGVVSKRLVIWNFVYWKCCYGVIKSSVIWRDGRRRDGRRNNMISVIRRVDQWSLKNEFKLFCLFFCHSCSTDLRFGGYIFLEGEKTMLDFVTYFVTLK